MSETEAGANVMAVMDTKEVKATSENVEESTEVINLNEITRLVDGDIDDPNCYTRKNVVVKDGGKETGSEREEVMTKSNQGMQSERLKATVEETIPSNVEESAPKGSQNLVSGLGIFQSFPAFSGLKTASSGTPADGSSRGLSGVWRVPSTKEVASEKTALGQIFSTGFNLTGGSMAKVPLVDAAGEKKGNSMWGRMTATRQQIPVSGVAKSQEEEKKGQQIGAAAGNIAQERKEDEVKKGVAAAGEEHPSEPKAVSTSSGSDSSVGLFSLRTNFVESSRSSLKALQTKARHMVSQNKRRYQEDGYDLDLSYITESIIAMGFPGGDMSSGLFGYVEGLYRNHMEDVLGFLDSRHEGKYKVYNLCSERLYDADLFHGKVACFPFDDHNCPPLPLLLSFCESCYDWLKGGLDRVCVVHCKAGMARTGLMLCCLLLYLKLFTTPEEAIHFYNMKRAVDGKALVLPSQIRYVHYFHRLQTEFDGTTPAPRKCILRGIRLHRCPYWIRPAIHISDHSGVLFSTRKDSRTRDLMPDDLWHPSPRKGVVVFALPGERSVTHLCGDFKVTFQDRHGEFYCWVNTNMMQTRLTLNTSELDGFDKRRLGSPGFQVEIVILDHDAPLPSKPGPKEKEGSDAAVEKQSSSSGVGTLAVAANATVSAFQQAFYGTPMGQSSEKKGGKEEKLGEKSNSKEQTSAKVEQSGEGSKDSIAKDLPLVDGHDDVFSDSDEEKGKVERNAAKDAFAIEETVAPQAILGSSSFGAFASALSSSMKDLGLKNAMESLKMPSGASVSQAKSDDQELNVSQLAADVNGGVVEKSVSTGDGSAQTSKENQETVAAQPGTSGNASSDGPQAGSVTTAKVAKEDVRTDEISLENEFDRLLESVDLEGSEFKALAAASAADASVFTFGDEDEFDDFED